MSNIITFVINNKEYNLTEENAYKCSLLKNLISDFQQTKIDVGIGYPSFDQLYEFLIREEIIFNYNLFDIENFYECKDFFNYLVNQMYENFDIKKFLSLNDDIKYELFPFISMHLFIFIDLTDWLDIYLKYFIKNTFNSNFKDISFIFNKDQLTIFDNTYKIVIKWYDVINRNIKFIHNYKIIYLCKKKVNQKDLEYNYKIDCKHGKYEEWFINGNKKSEEYFINGVQHGIQYYWNENGTECNKEINLNL